MTARIPIPTFQGFLLKLEGRASFVGPTKRVISLLFIHQ